jgi:hypothetical protein
MTLRWKRFWRARCRRIDDRPCDRSVATDVASTPTLYEGLVSYHVNRGSAMTSFRWEGDVTRTNDGVPFHYVENQDVVAGNTTSSFIRLRQQGNPSGN